VSLCLESQALRHLLKRGLYLPSADKVRDDALGIGIEIGAQKSLGFERLLLIADHYPMQWHSG
jgi:hypothetical protein